MSPEQYEYDSFRYPFTHDLIPTIAAHPWASLGLAIFCLIAFGCVAYVVERQMKLAKTSKRVK